MSPPAPSLASIWRSRRSHLPAPPPPLRSGVQPGVVSAVPPGPPGHEGDDPDEHPGDVGEPRPPDRLPGHGERRQHDRAGHPEGGPPAPRGGRRRRRCQWGEVGEQPGQVAAGLGPDRPDPGAPSARWRRVGRRSSAGRGHRPTWLRSASPTRISGFGDDRLERVGYQGPVVGHCSFFCRSCVPSVDG